MVKLTNVEKVTIICFNESEPQAEVHTYNRRMIRDLAKLTEDRPVDMKFVSENGNCGYTYAVPKKWVKIRASRILSEEARAAATEKLRRANAKRTESNLS